MSAFTSRANGAPCRFALLACQCCCALTRSRRAHKKGYMLSFSTFQKGRRWFGLKKLGLKGKQTAVSDCILLANKGRFVGSDDGDVWPKQQLAVDLARAAMVPVHRTAFATLHVNDMFFGETSLAFSRVADQCRDQACTSCTKRWKRSSFSRCSEIATATWCACGSALQFIHSYAQCVFADFSSSTSSMREICSGTALIRTGTKQSAQPTPMADSWCVKSTLTT